MWVKDRLAIHETLFSQSTTRSRAQDEAIAEVVAAGAVPDPRAAVGMVPAYGAALRLGIDLESVRPCPPST